MFHQVHFISNQNQNLFCPWVHSLQNLAYFAADTVKLTGHQRATNTQHLTKPWPWKNVLAKIIAKNPKKPLGSPGGQQYTLPAWQILQWDNKVITTDKSTLTCWSVGNGDLALDAADAHNVAPVLSKHGRQQGCNRGEKRDGVIPLSPSQFLAQMSSIKAATGMRRETKLFFKFQSIFN